MANVLDYLDWRGDLSLTDAPFSDVDALILSRLSYIPFDGIVEPSFQARPVALGEAAKKCLELVRQPDSTRRFRIDTDEDLLTRLTASSRFSNLQLCGYVNRFNEAQEEQFSAVTILLPEGGVVAFRGTDGTLVGWKEDFNMGFADTVPAQLDAVAYLEEASKAITGPIEVCGHSKGGNLAVYAGAFCAPLVQERIALVRSNDGPGFMEKTIQKEGFQRIIARTKTFLPQSSVVGMLLEHEEDFSIIHSTNLGIFQHDVYSWEIVRNGFITVEGLTNSSHFIDLTLKDWVANMTKEQREKMIDGIFSVLNASDGTTFRELRSGKNALAVLHAWADMDDETKASIGTAFHLLESSMKKAFPAMLEQWHEAKPNNKAYEFLLSFLTSNGQKA